MDNIDSVLTPRKRQLARSDHQTRWNERLGLVSFFVLGAGMLAPLNAFLNAIDYFSLFFGPHMDRLFTVCYLPMYLKVLITLAHYGSVTNRGRRITVGFLGFVLVLFAMPLIDILLLSDDPQHHSKHGLALTLTLCLVVISGVLDGIAQSAVFVESARCGLPYVKACVGGTASSGVIIGLLRIMTKASTQANGDTLDISRLRLSTNIYFAVSGCLAGCGLLVHLLVIPRLSIRLLDASSLEQSMLMEGNMVDEGTSLLSGADEEMLPLSRPAASGDEKSFSPRQDKKTKRDRKIGRSSLSPAFVLDDEDLPLNETDVFRESHVEYEAPHNFSGGYLHYELKAAAVEPMAQSFDQERDELRVKREVEQDWKETKRHYFRIVHIVSRVYPTYLALIVTYAATLSVFPGVIAEDVRFSTLPNGWYPVMIIFVYNLMDCIGKLLPIKVSTWKRRQALLPAIAVLRALLLIPLIALTARSTSSSSGRTLALMILLTCILGVSNGYLTALSLTLAPLYATQSLTTRQLSVGAINQETYYSSPSRPERPPVGPVGSLFNGSPLFSPSQETPLSDPNPEPGLPIIESLDLKMTTEVATEQAEELAVISIAFGLAAGALLSWLWLIVADGETVTDFLDH